ncbi:hypothetical protein H5410_057107 [Solanum commersonii]|uniref:Uncharacterized protein n=1 Tax=Solanum commersonii TaxID=4109 RepID=A0A9J5WNR1_SOLCO|nr:hypothetical protein H5410_057107 [Solanum commersonii]
MSKKRTEEVSIKFSASKGNMQTNIDNEQPIFCYIPRERRKKGQPLLEECTHQVHPPRKESSHTIFQDLKEKMTVPVAQVPSFTLEPSKGNTQESKKGKTLQRTSVFERIGRLTPRVPAFQRLGRKDERGSSKQVDEYATTSKTSIFHRLGTKRKSLSERRLLEHENQDSCDVTDDKEIHSVFPSRMKRKVALSITTNVFLKVKRSTIVVTNQFHRETNKEEDETITVGSQMEDSNFTQSSYHITVEEGPDIDDMDDDVQEAPPQLEDGVQSTIDDLKELI